jgi:8-oxo-dGTP diphosphatase
MNLLGVRIKIRPTRHEDLPFLQGLWNDGSVMRFQGYPEGMHATDEDMERWWHTLEQARRGERGMASLPSPHAIIETIDGTPIGELTYTLDGKGRASIDMKLCPSYWKQGYATEAVKVIMRELFATTGVKRILAEPAPENTAARQLLERTGFHPAPTENHPHRWECERADFAQVAGSSANVA